VKPVTWASMLNWSKTPVSAAMISSLARLRVFGAEPLPSSDGGGSR